MRHNCSSDDIFTTTIFRMSFYESYTFVVLYLMLFIHSIFFSEMYKIQAISFGLSSSLSSSLTFRNPLKASDSNSTNFILLLLLSFDFLQKKFGSDFP